jgi:hypothetical protein
MKKTKKMNVASNAEQETNLVKKVTLETLNKRYNALTRYLGVPCVVQATEFFNGAVMADAGIVHSKEYACYCVDLTPFKGEFDRIRFRAVSDGRDIAFGMLVDKDGNLDYIAKADKPGEATINIPLSANSKTLFATMPQKNGKPAWDDVTVELLTNGGMIADLCNTFSTIFGRIQALEENFKELVPSCDTKVEICFN